jgi:RNase adaptor protein for sRNA GlmZ degradation
MKLIVILGPPAVGKLTVANELSKITSLRVFHNHLTIDLGGLIYKRKKEEFWSYVEKLRLGFVKEASKQNVNLIMTLVNGNTFLKDFLKKLDRLATKNKIKVKYVYLTSNKETLLRRVTSASRKKHGKIKTKKMLRWLLPQLNSNSLLPSNILEIDNTNISAKNVAQKIKKEFKLK